MSKTKIIALALKVNHSLVVPYIDIAQTYKVLTVAGLSIPRVTGIDTLSETMGFLAVKDGAFSYVTVDEAYDILIALPLPITVPKDRHDKAVVYNTKKAALISDFITGKRKVMAAAMKFTNPETNDALVIISGRHWDKDFCHSLFEASCIEKNMAELGYARDSEIQGFVDNRGVFLTRSEAYEIAGENGQIVHVGGWEHRRQLFTENLY